PEVGGREIRVLGYVEVVVPVGELVVQAGQVDDERDGEDQGEPDPGWGRAWRRRRAGTPPLFRAASLARAGVGFLGASRQAIGRARLLLEHAALLHFAL